MTRRRRWFLPETPDVLGLLRRQVAVTLEGLGAFRAWAAGDPAAAEPVRDAEHRGDRVKRELLTALRAAFVTPLEPEDVFALSRGIDRLLNHARELIDESEAMACPPDERIAEMASLLADALHASTRRSQRSALTPTRQRRPPTARSLWSGGSSTPTTRAWPTCSESRTGTSASPAASSTAAA